MSEKELLRWIMDQIMEIYDEIVTFLAEREERK